MTSRYAHLLNACHEREQIAELAAMLAAHALGLAHSNIRQEPPLSAAQCREVSERLRDLRHTVQECERKLQRIVCSQG